MSRAVRAPRLGGNRITFWNKKTWISFQCYTPSARRLLCYKHTGAAIMMRDSAEEVEDDLKNNDTCCPNTLCTQTNINKCGNLYVVTVISCKRYASRDKSTRVELSFFNRFASEFSHDFFPSFFSTHTRARACNCAVNVFVISARIFFSSFFYIILPI